MPPGSYFGHPRPSPIWGNPEISKNCLLNSQLNNISKWSSGGQYSVLFTVLHFHYIVKFALHFVVVVAFFVFLQKDQQIII